MRSCWYHASLQLLRLDHMHIHCRPWLHVTSRCNTLLHEAEGKLRQVEWPFSKRTKMSGRRVPNAKLVASATSGRSLTDEGQLQKKLASIDVPMRLCARGLTL